ncbi:Centrosomal spindle body, CEP44-domain-containing protein [Chytriomyces sp. MP71]|nr:Centrosomal spindle body, CEP44-domain-containing protein [Chytriomyces sp. MP71]
MATASTGDLRNNIAKLQTELKSLRYTGSFDVTSLSRGEPMAFLPLMHFILLESDPLLAAHFAHLNHSLTAKRDIRFVESAWKLLRDVFDFKPVLSKEQFFSEGFAERKMLLLTEVAHMCKKMGADLARRKDPKSTKSAPPNAQAQPKTSSSASPLTPRLPINASWNLQTSVSNTETIKNNSHQVSAPKILTEFVPRLPQQAFDPTKYASFDILDELNQSYHEFVHLSPFRASLQGKELASDTLQKRQFRIPVDIPHSALKGADSRFHWPQSPSIGIQTEKTGIAAWEQCEEHMLSGVIADPDFSALYSDAPSHVLPTADISASMLHEPDTAPPPPAAYPQRQPPLRRSILKTSRVAEEQSTARDNPLRLQDLKASPRHQTGSTSADRVPVGEVDSSPIRGESRLLASTSATSGSRSLNRGDASSSGAGPAAAPVTRIEAARNRWNSAGLILPVGYKGNGSNGSAVVGSIKSVNGGVVEWAGGTSLNGVRGKRETSHEEVRQDVTGGTDIHHLEGLVSNLMGVVTKLWESNESMNENVSLALNKRQTQLLIGWICLLQSEH